MFPGVRDGGERGCCVSKEEAQRNLVVMVVKCLGCGGSYMKSHVIKLHAAVHIHTHMSTYKTGELQMSLVDGTNVNFQVLISLVILDVNIGKV